MEGVRGFLALLLLLPAAIGRSAEPDVPAAERQREAPDCPNWQLSCGKQKPVRSNGKDPFVNEDMQIRATFASGSEVCLTRSGDAARGFFVLLEPTRNRCSENPDRKSYFAIDSNFNSSFHKTLIETTYRGCDPLPTAILAHASVRDFTIPHHRVLVCRDKASSGIGMVVYAVGGGTMDSGEGLVEAIEYRATLGTTEQRAEQDVAAFRQFLGSLELGPERD
jgi:hypothetical protein